MPVQDGSLRILTAPAGDVSLEVCRYSPSGSFSALPGHNFTSCWPSEEKLSSTPDPIWTPNRRVDFRSFARKPVAVDSFLRCPGKNVDEGVGDFCQEQRRF